MSVEIQTSLKKGLVEEGSDVNVVAESTILRNLSKPNAFIPTQLMTLQDTKVMVAEAFVTLQNSRTKRLLILHGHQVPRHRVVKPEHVIVGHTSGGVAGLIPDSNVFIILFPRWEE